MFEVSFLIPKTDNAGEAFPDGTFAGFEDSLSARIGGWTRYDSAKGGWVNHATGVRHVDYHFIYVVALRSIRQGSDCHDLAKMACRMFRQECVYVRYLGQSEVVYAD